MYHSQKLMFYFKRKVLFVLYIKYLNFCTMLQHPNKSIGEEQVKDTKGAIRNQKSKGRQQHTGQQKTDKMTNNNLQNTTQKTTGRATGTPH